MSGISETHMSNPIFRVRIVGVLVTRAPGRVCMCPSVRVSANTAQCVPRTSTTEPHVMWGHFQLDRGLARAGAPGPSPFLRVTVSPVSPVSLSIPPPLHLLLSHVPNLCLGLVAGFSLISVFSRRV